MACQCDTVPHIAKRFVASTAGIRLRAQNSETFRRTSDEYSYAPGSHPGRCVLCVEVRLLFPFHLNFERCEKRIGDVENYEIVDKAIHVFVIPELALEFVNYGFHCYVLASFKHGVASFRWFLHERWAGLAPRPAFVRSGTSPPTPSGRRRPRRRATSVRPPRPRPAGERGGPSAHGAPPSLSTGSATSSGPPRSPRGSRGSGRCRCAPSCGDIRPPAAPRASPKRTAWPPSARCPPREPGRGTSPCTRPSPPSAA